MNHYYKLWHCIRMEHISFQSEAKSLTSHIMKLNCCIRICLSFYFWSIVIILGAVPVGPSMCSGYDARSTQFHLLPCHMAGYTGGVRSKDALWMLWEFCETQMSQVPKAVRAWYCISITSYLVYYPGEIRRVERPLKVVISPPPQL